MIDLGKYAVSVLSAYGLSFFVLGGLVAVSAIRSRKVKARLEAMERNNG